MYQLEKESEWGTSKRIENGDGENGEGNTASFDSPVPVSSGLRFSSST
jgi:hypothetical protein